jgi:hypothetical protein
MLLSLQHVHEVIEAFIAHYGTLTAYQQHVAAESREGYGPSPVPGFHVSCRIEGDIHPYLLEWPTTDYQLSLDQARAWEARIGADLPNLGRITSVSWAAGGWGFELIDGALADTECDAGIRDYLKKGIFPYIHCNNQGRVWLPPV